MLTCSGQAGSLAAYRLLEQAMRGTHTKRTSMQRDPEATRAALIEAARLEFEEAGFDATQSNKIAARAGYAPQTFYRHFSSKLEIFLAVYDQWVADEQKALDG